MLTAIFYLIIRRFAKDVNPGLLAAWSGIWLLDVVAIACLLKFLT